MDYFTSIPWLWSPQPNISQTYKLLIIAGVKDSLRSFFICWELGIQGSVPQTGCEEGDTPWGTGRSFGPFFNRLD